MKNNKKIFFIMSTNAFSGAEAVNFSIIDNLKDKYDFYWVSRKGPINQLLNKKKIKWIEITKLSQKEIKRVTKQYDPDILHATDFRASVVCSLAKTGKYLISHIHNNSPWIKYPGINSIIFLYAGMKSDHILTVSKSIEREYIFTPFLKRKIECIGNPISRKGILSKIDKENKIYDICCVARITKQKRPELFLQIIFEIKKQYPRIRSVWVGDGELKDNIIKLSKKLNLDKNIDFVGFQKDPYNYMQMSKIFMLTSAWEGYGLAVYEALSLGLPCVVSKVGGLPSIVDESCGALCVRKMDFVDNVIKLLKNKVYYLNKKERSIRRSVELENMAKYMQRIDMLYSEQE